MLCNFYTQRECVRQTPSLLWPLLTATISFFQETATFQPPHSHISCQTQKPRSEIQPSSPHIPIQEGPQINMPNYFPAAAVVIVLWCSVALLAVEAQSDACSSDLSTFLPTPFNVSGMSCTQVWNDFVLRYSQDQDNVLSIIVSALYTKGWIGMGFSRDGMMVGSSAMVGWIGRDKKPHMREYFLGGQSKSKVIVNKGELPLLSNTSKVIALYGPNLYMAFQLKFSAPVTLQSLIFAFGTASPIRRVLTKHEDKSSILFDFSAVTTPSSSFFLYPYKLKRTHGTLAIVGWGVLLPIGALVSRYCKQWNPLWFYMHMAIQFVGFIIGLSAVVVGIELYNKLHADVKAHRGLGIFVLVLGILQVMAFFLRPKKDSKYRGYWNLYHHWTGRLLILFAAVNIALGIKVGGAGEAWKVGYGVNIAVILLASVVFEIMRRLRSSKKSDSPVL